jgi:transposase-like protein
MALGRLRDESKEQQWRRWIAQWQTSGLSVAVFCARHGLAAPSFYAWRRTLQRRDDPPAAFVPVRLLPDEAPAPTRPLEVVLPDGRLVRVPAGFDAATLRQLLAVLREDASC